MDCVMDYTCASGVNVKNLWAVISIAPCQCFVIPKDKDYKVNLFTSIYCKPHAEHLKCINGGWNTFRSGGAKTEEESFVVSTTVI
jgi:hypothetical protein